MAKEEKPKTLKGTKEPIPKTTWTLKEKPKTKWKKVEIPKTEWTPVTKPGEKKK